MENFEPMKCITFDKEAQDALPQHIKDKMKKNQEDALRAKEQKDNTKDSKAIVSCDCVHSGSCRYEGVIIDSGEICRHKE